MLYTLTLSAVVETLDDLTEAMENPDAVLEGLVTEAVADVFESTRIRSFQFIPLNKPDEGESD